MRSRARWPKNPARREAYILSKLQSISAWRGSLVDTVLSKFVLPELRRGGRLSIEEVIRQARELFDRQIEFALAHRVRDPQLRVSKCGDAFAALYDVEYGHEIAPGVLAAAWDDVERALRNAAAMTSLLASFQNGRILIQPRLSFDIGEIKVAANPDVVWFGSDGTLRVVDWKVHSFGLRAAKEQLTVYASALRRGQPHPYFAFDPAAAPLGRYVLTEVQLLNNEVHDYSVSEEDIDELIDGLFEAGESIRLSCGDSEAGDLQAGEFLATHWPESCSRCNFKRICQERPA